MALSPNLRGALFMVVSMAGFATNDAITKYASAYMNVGQLMLIRGVFASSMILYLAWRSGALGQLGQLRTPLLLLRVAGELTGTITFLVALSHLPLGNLSAVMQALPLAVTMGAALIYREMVGWRRWLSIAVGFVGVLIVVRPGFEGFSLYALWAIVSVACCTVRDLATKRIPDEVPSLLISTATAISVTIFGAILLFPMGGWTPPPAHVTGLLIAAAGFVLIGYTFVIMSMRTGSISYIAPFRYTALLWSIAYGYLLFSDIPDLATIVGAAIIVASGLYMLYREQVVGRSRAASQSISPTMAPDGL